MEDKHKRHPYRDLKGRFCCREQGLQANQYRKWVKLGHKAEAEAFQVSDRMRTSDWVGIQYCLLNGAKGNSPIPLPSGLASDLQYHGYYYPY